MNGGVVFIVQDNSVARVCAITIAYKNPGELRRLLDSLKRSTRRLDSVVVIDNSEDALVIEEDGAVVREFAGEFGALEFMPMDKNVGSAEGYSRGMKRAHEAGFDWVWLLDQDGTVAPDCLEKLMPYADRCDVLCPVVLSLDDGESEIYFRGVINFWGAVHILPRTPGVSVAAISMFATHGALIGKNAMRRAGYYDGKNFFCGWEDFDYSHRLHAAGFNMLLVYDAVVYHPDLLKKYKDGKLALTSKLYLFVNRYLPLPPFLGYFDSSLTGLARIREDTAVTLTQKHLRGFRFWAAFVFSVPCLLVLKLSGKKINFFHSVKKYLGMSHAIE